MSIFKLFKFKPKEELKFYRENYFGFCSRCLMYANFGYLTSGPPHFQAPQHAVHDPHLGHECFHQASFCNDQILLAHEKKVEEAKTDNCRRAYFYG